MRGHGSIVGNVRFGLLGPIQAWVGARVIDLGTPQQCSVAAVLLLEPGRIVPVSRLEELLWGEQRPRTATKNVQVSVHHLRRAIAGLSDASVLTRGSGYLIDVHPESVDLHQFRRLVREAGEATEEAAVQLLREAGALWRGPALDGASQLLRRDLGPHLEEERLSALEARLSAELRLGWNRDCVTELAWLVRDHPLREELRALLMLALWRSGRRAEALAAFRTGRTILHDELGIDPGPRLQELHQRILRGEPGQAAGSAPGEGGATSERGATGHGLAAHPRNAGPVIPAELPRNVGDFVGRQAELAELDALLDAAEHNPCAATVVSVDGLAGAGKSALAVHWAHRVRNHFPDGTLFLDLLGHHPYHPPMSSAEALTELLRSLSVPRRDLPADAAALERLYRTALADGRRLLVLDNAASAEQVRPLLPGTPACMTLITSQSRLTGLVATSEAHRIGLGPLPERDAVTLLRLVIGAEHGQPDSMMELAALCGYLPLALRIVGANCTAHPDRLLSVLTHDLGQDRLTGLQVEGDGELAVRRAFDLTCNRLPAPALRLLVMLARTPLTSFTAEAAGALAGAGTAATALLIEKLAVARVVEEYANGRYRMHDLLWHYAATLDLLAQSNDGPARDRAPGSGQKSDPEAAIRRLIDWQLAVANSASTALGIPRLLIPPAGPGPQSPGWPVPWPDQETAGRWLELERSNLVSSVCHAAQHDPAPSAWRLALELRGLLRLHRYSGDWIATATAARSIAEQLGDVRAQAACGHNLGHAHWSVGKYDAAMEHFERALQCSRETQWIEGATGALSALGAVHHELGLHEDAIGYYERALATDGGSATSELRIITQGSLGLAHQSVGRLREAADCFQAVLDLVGREAGERPDIVATSLGNLGMTYADLGDLAQARQLMSRALDMYRQVGSRNGEANVLTGLADVDAECGRYDEATYQSTLAMRIARDIGDRRIECDALIAMARSRWLGSEPQAARERLIEAVAIAELIGYGRGVPDALCLLAAVETDLDDLPGAAISCNRALDLARSAAHRPTEARTLQVAAQLNLATGRYDAALRNARDALAVSRELGLKVVEARTLGTLSQILMATDEQAAGAAARQAADLLAVTGATAGPPSVPTGLRS